MFALRSVSVAMRTRTAVSLRAGASAAAAARPSAFAAAAAPAAPAASFSVQPVRLSSTATSFRHKKQKEWRTRAARGFQAMKTHAGCKKRFRFIGRYSIVCKHSSKVHKNYRQSKEEADREAHCRPARARKQRMRRLPQNAAGESAALS
jgi:ribosomal protein L35